MGTGRMPGGVVGSVEGVNVGAACQGGWQRLQLRLGPPCVLHWNTSCGVVVGVYVAGYVGVEDKWQQGEHA